MNRNSLYNYLLFKESMLKKKQLKNQRRMGDKILLQRQEYLKQRNRLLLNQNNNKPKNKDNQKKVFSNKFPSYLYDKSQNSVSIIRKKWK